MSLSGEEPHLKPTFWRLVVAAGEANGSLWVCVSLSSLGVIHRQPAPQWQVEVVGRTPPSMGEPV